MASLGNGFMKFTGEIRDSPSYSLIKNETLKKNFVVLNPGANSNSNLNDDEYLSLIALHEFGHLAGLRHEQVRAEAFEDSNCDKYEGLHGEKPFEQTLLFGEYDPNSIMSLCFNDGLSRTGLNFIANDFKEPLYLQDHSIFSSVSVSGGVQIKARIGLSKGDQETLNNLYLLAL